MLPRASKAVLTGIALLCYLLNLFTLGPSLSAGRHPGVDELSHTRRAARQPSCPIPGKESQIPDVGNRRRVAETAGKILTLKKELAWSHHPPPPTIRQPPGAS